MGRLLEGLVKGWFGAYSSRFRSWVSWSAGVSCRTASRSRPLGSNTTTNTKFMRDDKVLFLPSTADVESLDDAIGFGKTLTSPHPEGDWTSMAFVSDGSYGVPEGIISSFPCTCTNGVYSIVQGLDIDDYSRGKIDASAAELAEERDAVKELGLI